MRDRLHFRVSNVGPRRKEMKTRNVMGVSAWRKALQLNTHLELVIGEGRHDDVKPESDRLLRVLTEDKVYGGEMKADTLGRRLGLAKEAARC